MVGVRKDNLTTHILCEGGLLCVQSKCIRMECLLPCIINKVPIYTISNIFTFNTDFIHPSINPCNYQCTYKLYSTIYSCATIYISSSSQISSLLPLSLSIYLSISLSLYLSISISLYTPPPLSLSGFRDSTYYKCSSNDLGSTE